MAAEFDSHVFETFETFDRSMSKCGAGTRMHFEIPNWVTTRGSARIRSLSILDTYD